MQGFTVIDLIILVVYLAAVLFAGLHFSKKEMKGKEFFHGDGTIPWWVTSVSIFAKSDFFPVTGRKLLCRVLDSLVCTAGYACGYPHNYKVFLTYIQ